ncbi:DUF2089 family protein [Treponema pedis]
MEKELGISYPTVRNKIEEINCALGISDSNGTEFDIGSILKKIKSGEMKVEKALSVLRGEDSEE